MLWCPFNTLASAVGVGGGGFHGLIMPIVHKYISKTLKVPLDAELDGKQLCNFSSTHDFEGNGVKNDLRGEGGFTLYRLKIPEKYHPRFGGHFDVISFGIRCQDA
jgi:hypothetical protein